MKIKNITELRSLTGAGIVQCSKALKDSDGDFEKAKEILISSGGKRIAKMENREAGSGKVFSYIHIGSKKGSLIHLFSETDFVSNTDEFNQLGNSLALHVVASQPNDINELLSQPFVKDEYVTVKEMIESLQLKVGEKILIKQFSIFN